VATNSGDYKALMFGIGSVILIVVATDQLVWRPLIAWSDKFKFEQVESADRVSSPILALLRRSNLLSSLPSRCWSSIEEPIYRRLSRTPECRVVHPVDEERSNRPSFALYALAVAAIGIVGWGALQAVIMLKTVNWPDLKLLLEGAAATFLRVNAALLISAVWTVPVGVAIGLNPRLSRIVQPTAQVLASIPATAFFPIILIGLVKIGGGLGIGSIALMLLGTQWYILFNVIAGALAIPSDLRDVSTIFRFDRRERWMTVILPGIFPYLVTGLITASGGAWNASIVAEYFRMNEHTYTTLGLGAQISLANDSGNGRLLLLSTVVMAALVVAVNRLLWKPLFRLAEGRYRLDS
jgi:NitT/TauT family transport system permease protein